VIDARIDLVSPAGVVEGWARCQDRPEPVDVTLWLDGRLIGAATASAFRRDLLAAGIGHGHYAYRCKLRLDEVLHGMLELREAGGDVVLASYTIEPGSLIPSRRVKQRTIESLSVAPARWAMDDVKDHFAALDLETTLFEFGPKRYIAMVYRFLLGRWPDQAEYDYYLPDMRRDLISASDIFRTVLNSDERQNNGLDPLSPFDPRYPLRGRREPFFSATPLQDRDQVDISTATLVSEPWDLQAPQIFYDGAEQRLICHPPATGMTVARINNLPLTGRKALMISASVDHPAAAVEIAIALVPASEPDENFREPDALASRAAWFSGWRQISYGAAHLLNAGLDDSLGPAALFMAARLAAGAPNNDNALASFSDLVIL
jgi:hypothetical protein